MFRVFFGGILLEELINYFYFLNKIELYFLLFVIKNMYFKVCNVFVFVLEVRGYFII